MHSVMDETIHQREQARNDG
jgi:hypothetical protein